MKKRYNWLLVIGYWLLVISNTALFAEELPFQDGEELEFSLKWMGFIGGKSTIKVEKEAPLNQDQENEYYLLKATLKTVGLADIFFKVRDQFNSLVTLNSQRISPIWWEATGVAPVTMATASLSREAE